MKILLFLISVTLLSSASCKKDTFKNDEKVYITHEILVAEQENVDHYNVEVLHKGEYVLIDNFFAVDQQEFKYVIDVDVTPYFVPGEITYTRIQAVDKDEKYIYSWVLRTKEE